MQHRAAIPPERAPSGRCGLVPFILLLGALSSTFLSASDLQPIGHWEFRSDRQQGSSKFISVAGQSGRIVGQLTFANDPPPAQMVLGGRGRLSLAEGLSSDISLPKEAMTATAWVRISKPTAWGGILSAVQDNGSDERGWVLGYQGSTFSFALATAHANHLTYLTTRESFELDRWYHLAGTYDGPALRIYLNGQLKNESDAQQGPILYPDRLFYEIGAYHDRDENFAMNGALHEIKLFDRALSAAELREEFQEKGDLSRPVPPPNWLPIAAGPYVDWIDRTPVQLTWETDQAIPARVEIHHPRGEVSLIEQSSPKKNHRLVLENLDPLVEYEYRILGDQTGPSPSVSPLYRFDATFFYTPEKNLPDLAGERVSALAERTALRILNHTGVRQGYCVVLGADQGDLALELIRQSDLKLLIVESDPDRVNRLRRRLDRAGVYGVRASVHPMAGETLPFGAYLANLVVSESLSLAGRWPDYAFEEVYRILRPAGGLLYWGNEAPSPSLVRQIQKWIPPSHASRPQVSHQEGTWMALRRIALDGAGEWTHQYASPDNSSCSKDELVQGDLGVLWWGDPGPRPMPDRGGRNPAPLSVNGRLYVQGDRVLFGMDAYNGSVLWSKSIPEIRRANVPRDSSNMGAGGQNLYLLQGRYCLAIDGQSGTINRKHEVSGHQPGTPRLWGYLAHLDPLLVGTSMKPGPRYTGDDGEWYEDFTPDEVSRVTSVRIFGYDQDSGEERWRYEKGVIINSTITIAKGMIFFLESRSPEALEVPTHRLPPDLLRDVQLVCLDLNSGQTRWERAQDFSKCEFMVYMSYGNDTLVVTGTDRDKHYHTFAFNTKETEDQGGGELEPLQVPGTLLWSESHKEDKGHHSGHLQHPVIIGDTFYSDQRAFSLREGKLLRTDLPERRGCGTMSAAQNSIFFRHYFHSQWDLKSDRRIQFEGLRSGCWLGMIPANGLLLAPEASAGCSCANAIQTSVGYIPHPLAPGRMKSR